MYVENDSAWSSPEDRHSGAEHILYVHVCTRVRVHSSIVLSAVMTGLPGGDVDPRLLSVLRRIETQSEAVLCPVPVARKLARKEEGSRNCPFAFHHEGTSVVGSSAPGRHAQRHPCHLEFPQATVHHASIPGRWCRLWKGRGLLSGTYKGPSSGT